jgi:hypothetical protein
MSKDEFEKCSCVVDCAGLHEIASTKSDNLKSLYLDSLKNGVIAVPSRVWQEYSELYEDEAAIIEASISRKINVTRAYQIGAARIADQKNSGFSRGPYDNESDLYTASIASIEHYILLTTKSQLPEYFGMSCKVLDLLTWVEGRETGFTG